MGAPHTPRGLGRKDIVSRSKMLLNRAGGVELAEERAALHREPRSVATVGGSNLRRSSARQGSNSVLTGGGR
jgi:hypothetical protein